MQRAVSLLSGSFLTTLFLNKLYNGHNANKKHCIWSVFQIDLGAMKSRISSSEILNPTLTLRFDYFCLTSFGHVCRFGSVLGFTPSSNIRRKFISHLMSMLLIYIITLLNARRMNVEKQSFPTVEIGTLNLRPLAKATAPRKLSHKCYPSSPIFKADNPANTQRRHNVAATSRRCSDVVTTLL